MSDIKPEGEEAYQLADKWLSEPVMLLTGLCIFLLFIAVVEYEAIWDFFVGLVSK